MIDVRGKALLLHGGHRLAAANRGKPRAGGDRPRHFAAAGIEGRRLEHAHGPVPEQGRGVRGGSGERVPGRGADIDRQPPGRHAAVGRDRAVPTVMRWRVERVGDHEIGRQQECGAASHRLRFDRYGKVEALPLHQGRSQRSAPGGEKGVRHAPADEHAVDQRQQVEQRVDLAADLGAADDQHEGSRGIVEQPAELPQFAVQQQSAEGPIHLVADGRGRCVSAVRGAEGVVHVDFAQGRKLGCERRIVALLAGVEPEVLAQADGAVAKSGRGLPGGRPDAVRREGDSTVEYLCQRFGHRAQAELGVDPAAGPAAVGEQHHPGAGIAEGADRRRGFPQPGCVQHLPVRHGNVEVDPYGDSPAAEVDGTVGERGLKAGGRNHGGLSRDGSSDSTGREIAEDNVAGMFTLAGDTTAFRGYVLGIETSCDDTACAVLDGEGRVLSSQVSSQLEVHRPFGGVVPEAASREHLRNWPAVSDAALAEAGIGWSDIGAVAATRGPGLVGSLLVGLSLGKAISYSLGVPFLAVHHLEGHLFSPLLRTDGASRPLPESMLGLVVSGGHTSLLEVDGGTCAVTSLAETRDDAVGEAFDKVGRRLGLPFPGGAEVDRLAELGDPSARRFGIATISSNELAFSYSGLKSQALRALGEIETRTEIPQPALAGDDDAWPREVLDLLAGFRRAAVDQLIQRLDRLCAERRVERLSVSGGVAANRLLRREVRAWGERRGVEVLLVPLRFSGDNAAMIAHAGLLRLRMGDADDPRSADAESRIPFSPSA